MQVVAHLIDLTLELLGADSHDGGESAEEAPRSEGEGAARKLRENSPQKPKEGLVGGGGAGSLTPTKKSMEERCRAARAQAAAAWEKLQSEAAAAAAATQPPKSSATDKFAAPSWD